LHEVLININIAEAAEGRARGAHAGQGATDIEKAFLSGKRYRSLQAGWARRLKHVPTIIELVERVESFFPLSVIPDLIRNPVFLTGFLLSRE